MRKCWRCDECLEKGDNMRVLFFLWLIFIFALTSIPQNKISSTTTLSSLCHLFFYATLSLFYFARYNLKKRKMLVFIVIIAAFDEVHQFFIPGRYPSFIDFFLDVIGGVIVCLSL